MLRKTGLLQICESLVFLFHVCRLLLNRVNRNLFLVFAHSLKLNRAVDQGKEGIVRTNANIIAGMDMRASLAVKDIAGKNKLTVRSFRAKALGFGITAVLG